MAAVTIELPSSLQEFAEAQVASGAYASVGDYIQAVIAEEKAARDHLLLELRKGRESGDSPRGFDEIWDSGVEQARLRAA